MQYEPSRESPTPPYIPPTGETPTSPAAGYPQMYGPPPRKKNHVGLIVGAAAGVVFLALVAVTGAAAFLSSGNQPAAAPITTSTPNVVRVGGTCSGEGGETSTIAGDRVRCIGGTWTLKDTPPAPEPAAEENLTGPVGTTFTVTGDDSEAHYTLTKTTQKLRDKWGQRPERGVYLLVYIKAEVLSGSEYVCSCSLQFVTAKGKVYEEAFAEFKGLDGLDAADVAGGQNADGWVVFDVPKSALAGGRIGFKPNVFDGEVAYWTL